MLQIITGLPGAGKTLYTLAKVIPQYRGRQIYFYGIPGIDHEHFNSKELEDPEKWYELPEGSVVVIDEAQKVFPIRRAGSPVPEKCSQFETHRHRGFDVLLITQDATTLDVHIRKLSGSHIHVHRLFGGQSANIYTYANYENKPTDRNIQKSALSTKTWKYDKKTFDLYKSADLHTVKRNIPIKLYIAPVMVLVTIALGIFAFTTIKALFATDEEIPSVTQSQPGQTMTNSQENDPADSPQDYLDRFVPRIAGMPWTAPIYDKAMKVRTFPKPFCIIKSPGRENERCSCYSQQITKMNVDVHSCRDIANNGWFDYTREDSRSGRRAERGTQRPSSAVTETASFSSALSK